MAIMTNEETKQDCIMHEGTLFVRVAGQAYFADTDTTVEAGYEGDMYEIEVIPC